MSVGNPSEANAGHGKDNSLLYADHDKAYESQSRLVTPASLRSRYVFMRELGAGGLGRLFLAVRLSDKKLVAIKQLNIESVKNWKEYELFHREADVLASLHVPGVAAFYEAIDCLEDDPPCSYIVQEYIEGRSLARILKDGHRFKVKAVFDIVLQLLKILRELQLHNPPVIHRDIKPSNVMVSGNDEDGYRVTLIDFGAVANPQVQGGGSTVAGTFGYMPPEQLVGRPVPASDIYSLGAMTVQLLSGKSPADLPVKDFRLIFEPELEHMSPVLIATLREMLEPKVENRLSDVNELRSRFAAFKEDKYEIAKFEKDLKDRESKLKETVLKKWKQVRYIGDNGTMALWQLLPDSVPRFFITVDDIIVLFYKNGTIVKKIEVHSDREFLDAILAILLLIWGVANIPLCIGLCIALGYGLTQLIVSFLYAIGTVWQGILSCTAWIMSIAVCIILAIKVFKLISNLNDRLSPKLPVFADYPDMYNLFRNGRKTVAIIKDIQYVPVKGEVLVRGNLRIFEQRPCFRVSYGFNPPDDLSGDVEIVNSCVVYDEPQGHYQIGDPLPILYLLVTNDSREVIKSMPFPFPIDYVCYDDLIDEYRYEVPSKSDEA